MRCLIAYFGLYCNTVQNPPGAQKMEGPSTEIFLGITVDTLTMECSLPLDKFEDLQQIVGEARKAKKVRLKQLQPLLGELNFPCHIMPIGRIFCRRLSAATSEVKLLHHYIRLSNENRADLERASDLL